VFIVSFIKQALYRKAWDCERGEDNLGLGSFCEFIYWTHRRRMSAGV
jgi:hypothetical protein